ncbi:MAG: hypothetical protein HOP33_18065 [Verrucomicrobia bacterium]|nr:hypothetical protein [Verrucomicrobiota bacterium]
MKSYYFVIWVCLVAGMNPVIAGNGIRTNGFIAVDNAQAEIWQNQARQRLFKLMMGGDKPQRLPLETKILQHAESPNGGYGLEEVSFQSLPDRRVHAWIALPKHFAGKVGAVLALHGHGGTGSQVVRGEGLYAYGRALAEMGYVVISPDIGQHELQHTNWTLMGERTWDALRCLDYLETRPEVDSSRLAVAGLSLGGETTMYVAAMDERIKAACSSGWLTTVANMKNGHCSCWNSPGLEENFDFADIFACVAPRPLVLEIGEKERAPGGFPVAIARPAFSKIRAAYGAFGAETNAVLDVHPGGHVFHGEEFWPRLDHALGITPEARRFQQAERNSHAASEAFERCHRYVEAWLAHSDPTTGLIPRNLREGRDFWNGRDSAADNYPFMVLTAALTDRPLMNGRLRDILRTEQKLTARVDRLADDYSFSKHGWRRQKFDLDATIFDSAEYVKDGLIPLTEWLGPSPWSKRMIGLVDDIWKNATVETSFGRIPTLNIEVNGDLLQAGARLYWFTGQKKYLDWTLRLSDYFLLGTNHPTRDFERLRLRDHGCEVINGLAELYVAAKFARPEKAAAYQQPIHEMFDRILAVGRNEHGMLYDWVNPKTGEHSTSICDTWGYDYDGFYSIYLLDGTTAYRDAAHKPLENLEAHYSSYPWEGTSADGYADSIEGAINLYNREPVTSTARWIDREMRVMWAKQQPDGIIEGWHGDGNFARTSIMYALWKTQGLHVEPWRADVCVGAVREGETLYVSLTADKPWSGKLLFDHARHRDNLKLPLDYPRINQFPEWFTVERGGRYRIQAGKQSQKSASGRNLIEGLPVKLATAGETRIEVELAKPDQR